MKRLMVFFFITVFFESTFGQTHSIGFRAEPFLFLSKNDPVSKIHSETDQIFLDFKSFFEIGRASCRERV